MTDLQLFSNDGDDDDSQSPFDAIRRVRSDGSEYWSARELMPVMGYAKWDHFETPLNRAMRSAENQGFDPDTNFPRSRKVSGARGPAQSDFELTRFAAYLVAMNGDPNKPEVAAAQAYFAIRTHEAETRAIESRPALQGEELFAHAVLQAAGTIKRIESERAALAEKVEADAPMVAKALAHTGSVTSINRQEFAREVQTWGQKTHQIWILQEHVFDFLAYKGMTIRPGRTDSGQATASAIRSGWAENDKYQKKIRGEKRTFYTARLFPRGQDVAWKWITKYVADTGTLQLPPDAMGDAS